MKLKVGDKVLTLVEKMVYGGEFYIPVRSVGVVGAVKVPCVRSRSECGCRTFNCVDFVTDNGVKRSSYHNHEIKIPKIGA